MKKKIQKHVLRIDDFDVEIPVDEPVFTLTAICGLLDMEYHRLHEILKEGIIEPRKSGKRKKLFSREDIKCIKYIQYLMEEEGVNLKGVKVILDITRVEEE